MPETIFIRDFSAGWCPSDDAVDGRPNALLQMDNLELDRNGALQLIHGTQIVWTGFSGTAHTMFSRFINGVRCDYSATNTGSVYRNNTSIIGSGDTTNAAFGTAFNFTLICSGSQRFKDSGTTVIELGVDPPTIPPTVTQSLSNTPTATIGDMSAPVVVVTGSMVVLTSPFYLDQCTTDANGNYTMQSHLSTPFNATILSSSPCSGTSTDQDFIVLNGFMFNPFGVSLEFDVLLDAGDAGGDVVNDMYVYAIPDISKQATFDSYTGAFTIKMERDQFNRIGANALDWSTVYGFRLTIKTNKAGAVVINIWGANTNNHLFTIQGGTTAQFGTYQYAQVNVNNTGSYQAKSILGPTSGPITLNGVNAVVSIQNPTSVDPQCNEAWIYRKGGNLGGTWYRVAVSTSPFSSTVVDCMGDQAALDLDITIDVNLISVADITDKIFDLLGPIEGRWYYFTANFMYPSEINDPDLVNPSLAVRICGSASELFMWARNVSANVVIVGTSVDCYLLTGTFSTFPDGTIDTYYQSLGVKFPPVTFDAISYGGAVYYLAVDGWRFVLPTSFGTTYSSQNNQSMVAPNTDRLYKGELCYEYPPAIVPVSPGASRSPITIAKNKLWTFPAGTGRGEVWDFQRQYWRTFSYASQAVTACVATQDNRILVFCGDEVVREYDYASSKLIDGTTKQTYNALFTYKDNGKPRQRKDSYTFKTRCYTGNNAMFLNITDEKGSIIGIPSAGVAGLVSSTGSSEIFIDISQPLSVYGLLPKAYQVNLFGTSNDFLLEDWSIDYDSRPIPLTFLNIYPTNLGSATKKRLRTWPLVIDTLGSNVTFTPSVDGVNQSSVVFNTHYKQTVFYYFVTDVFGIDYGGTLYDPNSMMEVWDTGTGQLGSGLQPDLVENLPLGHEFDQVGPIEIFRYGKIARMALRVLSQGTPIPFKVYLSDVLIYQDQFNVAVGLEDEYVVDLPKGVSGRILRVELGPCNFVFYRYFMKFQVAMSGGQENTELRWLTVPGLSSSLAQGI